MPHIYFTHILLQDVCRNEGSERGWRRTLLTIFSKCEASKKGSLLTGPACDFQLLGRYDRLLCGQKLLHFMALHTSRQVLMQKRQPGAAEQYVHDSGSAPLISARTPRK